MCSLHTVYESDLRDTQPPVVLYLVLRIDHKRFWLRVGERGGVVHLLIEAGDDHNDQGNPGERAEIPPIAQVFRRRVFVQLVIEEREYRQPMVDPPRDRIANRRRAHAAYPQPIRTTVSEVKI